MKPEFLCIGAQKAGTTWLYSNLAQQAGLSMPPVKEFHYFDRARHYPKSHALSKSKAIDRLRSAAHWKLSAYRIYHSLHARDFRRAYWWTRYCLFDYTDNWYRSLFALERGITGDISPSYATLGEEDVARIHKAVPWVKIIFMIRNPIERAWSMFRFRRRKLNQPQVDVEDFDAFRSFVDSPDQELRSDYRRTIDLYCRHFEPKNLLIGFYDAIARDPARLLECVLRHIGAEGVRLETSSLSRMIHRSQRLGRPDHFSDYLKAKYEDDIEELASRFGSYAIEWRSGLSKGGFSSPERNALHIPVVYASDWDESNNVREP